MNTRSVLLSVFGLWFATWSFAATNVWTKSTSGNWEEPFWSLGELPSLSHEVIVFNNPGFKALAIAPSTVANEPNSLRINDLYVDAPSNSHNLLLLNYAGVNSPLTIAGGYIGHGGSLLSYSSGLHANQLAVNGTATFAEFAESQVGQAWIGSSRFGPADSRGNTAELTLSNGLFSASQIEIGDGIPGVFNQYGGSSRVGSLSIERDGRFSLHGGALDVTNSIVFTGAPALDREVLLSGGTLRAAFVSGSNGRFTQSGGRAELDDVRFAVDALEDVDYALTGGVLVSSNFIADVEDRGSFSFHQSGGIHTNTRTIFVSSPASRRGEGTYRLVDGLLFTPHLELPNGLFLQAAGTSQVQRLSLSGFDGFYDQSGGASFAQELSITELASYQVRGGQLWTSNTTVQFAITSTPDRPLIWLNGGEHHVERRLWLDSGGVYIMGSGTLAARFITLEAGGVLRLDGGNIVTNELLLMRGGILFCAAGDWRFGGLRVPAGGTIDFPFNPSTVRFTDAGYTNGALNSELLITNWTAGSDHLFIGTITDDQLSLIRFVNPSGYPPGTYRARVTHEDEIVPVELRPLAHTRHSDHMVLTWEPNYALYSSTNVIGPYQQVSAAVSPYTNSFTEAMRFFIVRPIPPLP